ncbi:MAG: hypothetical protein Q9168_000423 [Polycauliona sp. 1 TL-2023]
MEHDLTAKDSHESFHSTRSQQEEAPTTNPGPVADLHTAALQAAGLPIYDIDTFLNDPRNQASPETKSPPQKKQRTNHGLSSSSSAPEQIGSPKTTHNVPALHQLCQERGLVAEYDIDGDQAMWFGGTVTVGAEVIMSDQRWQNKKETKERLAELALPLVREMELRQKAKPVPSSSSSSSSPNEKRELERNWVGMLVEYFNAVDPTHSKPGSVYTEYALGLSFACTCSIPSSSTDDDSSMPLVLGSSTTAFSTKKAARNNAAKAAIQHLISRGELNPDGSCKAKKKVKLGAGPTVKVESKGIEVKKDASYANRVNDLAPLLSLNVPVYRFTPSSAAAPNMFSGAAYFTGDALFHEGLKNGVGEVRNVYGKKNAKEECAREVWEVLKGVARGRGVEFEEAEA